MCSVDEESDPQGKVNVERSPPSKPNEIRLKKPYFFEIISEIEKPIELFSFSSRANVEKRFTFPSKLNNLKKWETIVNKKSRDGCQARVLFRFYKVSSRGPQDDCFPTGLKVEVNQQRIPLPPCASPLDVTAHLHKSSKVANRVRIGWKMERISKAMFAVAIFAAQKTPPEELIPQITRRAPIAAEATRALIRRLAAGDGDCCVETALKASLRCPLLLCPMRLPVRSALCRHLQCFDAAAYLTLNAERATWRCPLCNVAAPPESLALDAFFLGVLASPLSRGADEVEIAADASWTPVRPPCDHALTPE